jgi:hypothetical protein
MGWRTRLSFGSLVALMLVVAAGCGRPREVEARRELLDVPSQIEQVQQKVLKTRILDDSGNLEPSEVVVSGLRLPRGLAEQIASERRHIYDTTVDRDKLIAYFGPRLETGEVKPGGGAVKYVRARSRESAGEIFFDVLIGTKPGVPGHNFVDIREYPPMPLKWPSNEEVQRKLAEQARNAH